MLERVPATAESATHVFLRNLEQPCRTSRRLDPRFWRHGRDEITTSTAPWWPNYLQQIRQIRNVPQSSFATTSTEDPRISVTSNPLPQNRSYTRLPTDRLPEPRRHYSISAPTLTAQPKLKEAYDVYDFQHEPFSSVGSPHSVRQPQDTQRSRLKEVHRETGDRLPSLDDAQELDIRSHDHSVHVLSDQAKELHSWLTIRQPLVRQPEPDSEPVTAESSRSDSSHMKTRRALLLSRLKAKKAEERLERMRDPSYLLDVRTSSDLKIQALNVLLNQDGEASEEDIDQVWQLFVSLPNQQSFAHHVFPLIARTSNEARWSRIAQVFHLIPQTERDLEIYKGALELNLRLGDTEKAIAIAFEAQRNGNYLLSYLLADLVRKEMWNAVAGIVDQISTDSYSFPRSMPEAENGQLSQNLSELMAECATNQDLPARLQSLSDLIDKNHPAFLSNMPTLRSIRFILALVCVRTTSIMSSISTESLFYLLGLHSMADSSSTHLLHLSALETFYDLPIATRKYKADLALLTYRNFRFVYPDHCVSSTILENLIVMAGEGRKRIDTFQYLLDEIKVHMGPPREGTYWEVLQYCAKDGNVDAVETVFDWYLTDYEKPRNVKYLSPLIHVHAVLGNVDDAQQQFDSVSKRFGMQQDVFCWNMLILAHARSSNPSSAFQVYGRMRQIPTLTPNSHTYGTLLSVCATLKDIDAAHNLIITAREAAVPITMPMINVLLKMYLDQNKVRTAYSLALATAQSGTSESSTRTWNLFLLYYAKKGNTRLLMKTREVMQEHHAVPDGMTYAAILTCLTVTGNTNKAVEYLHDMHKQEVVLVEPLHYSIILKGLVREQNRDMATVIRQEMKTCFPGVDARDDKTMLCFQGQRNRSNPNASSAHSVDMLASLLDDLRANYRKGSLPDIGTARPVQASSVAFEYIETTLRSLIQNRSFDLAERLLNHLDSTSSFAHDSNLGARMRTPDFVNMRMSLALARKDTRLVQDLWRDLFERTLNQRSSIAAMLVSGETAVQAPVDYKEAVPSAVLSKSPIAHRQQIAEGQALSLTKPLNVYMTAMGLEDQQHQMLAFIHDEFEPVGFKLTSFNWNKYIQVLALSRSTDHQISVFKVFEKEMFRRAQSWTLLKRGVIRRKQTSYNFERVSPEKPRPILLKQNEYSFVDRLTEMERNPERSIPTYTTTVHLAVVLQDAQQQAHHGNPSKLVSISNIAPRTKKFLEHMPRSKDHVQGTLLRNHTRSGDLSPRPRSENSFRTKIISFGGPNEVSALASGEVTPSHSSYKSAILPGKGRFETRNEVEQRLAQRERLVSKNLYDIDGNTASYSDRADNQLDRNIPAPIGTPTIFDLPGLVTGGPGLLSIPSLNSTELQKGMDEDTKKPERTTVHRPLQRLTPLSIRTLKPKQDIPQSTLPVREQLELVQKRGDVKVISLDKAPLPRAKMALEYVELRRLRASRAAKQRREAFEDIRAAVAQGNIRDSALVPRSRALIRSMRRLENQKRLQDYKESQGRPLLPRPKTKLAYRRHRRKFGGVEPRPVADLGRRKGLFAVRSGRAPEKRQPRIMSTIDQEPYLVQPDTGHLLLDRRTPLPGNKMQVTRGKIDPDKRLVKTKVKASGHRSMLFQRLARRREHLQANARAVLGDTEYRRREQEAQDEPQFQPFR